MINDNITIIKLIKIFINKQSFISWKLSKGLFRCILWMKSFESFSFFAKRAIDNAILDYTITCKIYHIFLEGLEEKDRFWSCWWCNHKNMIKHQKKEHNLRFIMNLQYRKLALQVQINFPLSNELNLPVNLHLDSHLWQLHVTTKFYFSEGLMKKE